MSMLALKVTSVLCSTMIISKQKADNGHRNTYNVILQMLSDTWQVEEHIHSGGLQNIRWADTAQL